MSRMLFETTQPGGILALVDKGYHPGSTFWVGSLATHGGVDGTSYGRSPTAPFATLDYAFASCTADKGDVIFVLPGHTETVSGSITIDASDVKVIGLGQGQNRPTITFDNTAGEVNVTADDVTIKNMRFVSAIDNLVNFVDADANDLVLEGCDFLAPATFEALCFVNFATTKDNLTIRKCFAQQPADPAGTDAAAGTGFLYCVDSENILLEDNIIVGEFETAIIHNKTTKCQNLWSHRNTYRQDLSGAEILLLVAASSGHSRGDSGHTPDATDATVALCIGAYDIEFWFGTDSQFSNDSGGGGQGMIAAEAACS